MDTKTEKLIEHWREVGPIEWAEGVYGWIGLDSDPISLIPWQRAVLGGWWAHRDEITTLGIV